MEYSLNKTNIFNKLILLNDNSINNIVQVIVESVEDLKITGEEKKRVAMILITEYMNAMPRNDYTEILLSSLEAGVISDMIDLIILASNKKLKLNKKTISKMLIKYLKCCISIISKKGV